MAITEQQQLWNEFLTRWPREKLHELILEEYVSVGDRDTFTYWLETKTRPIASIQGSTSAKFGIYKRSGEAREQNGVTHGSKYSWRTSYGSTETEAFAYVKEVVQKIAEAAFVGDLDTIEGIKFSPMVKWKIAFLYQNPSSPVLINIFSHPILQVLSDSEAESYPELYREILSRKGTQDLLAYGDKCWKVAEQKRKELEIRRLVEKFLHVSLFAKNYLKWAPEILESFCQLMLEAHKQKLDVFTINSDRNGVIRIGRKELSSDRAGKVFSTFDPLSNRISYFQRYGYEQDYFSSNVGADLLERLSDSGDLAKFRQDNPIDRKPYWPEDYSDESEVRDTDQPITYSDQQGIDTMPLTAPLNQILFGPPGTGKTYHTMEAAVKAAVPDFFHNLAGSGDDLRDQIKTKYSELVKTGHIRFVTFHQSYGYEEFVEGISAKSDNGQISYYQKDGVFKRISKDAQVSELKGLKENLSSTTVWRYTCEGLRENRVLEHCLKHGVAAFNYPEVGNLSENDIKQHDTSEFEQVSHRDNLFNFYSDMRKGDLVVVPYDGEHFQAIGIVTGDYEFVEDGLEVNKAYVHQRKVRWLVTGLREPIKPFNDGKGFDNVWCAPVGQGREVQYSLFEFLVKNLSNHVLIIDEINRGNISKIFGELITLIEPSKRHGADEALEVTLPYSGDKFSVPKNLHIIGTMNTADRSLALMDTALRRRFDFKEMMPKPELFENKEVKGINLTKLLEVMNQRITVLLDREHTLGHAFFFPSYNAGDQAEAFEELKSAFKNKIIPLLQEYFFEDWNKIRLVLGDNQKDETLRFVEKNKQNYSALFGGNHGLDVYEDSVAQFSLASFEGNETVWDNPNAYIAIYSPAGEQSQTSVQADSEH